MGQLGKAKKSGKNKKIKYIDPQYLDGERQKRSNPFQCKDDLYNAKPKNSKEQEMPRSVLRIMKLKEQVKTGVYKKKQQKKNANKPSPDVVFTRHKGENDFQFLGRINKVTKQVIEKTQFEVKYGTVLGEDGAAKPRVKKKATVEKKQQKNKEKQNKDKEKKKKKQDKNQSGFEHLTDNVKFGEVAMQPPQLSAKPRKSSLKEDKPGKKSLLLKEILSHNASHGGQGRSKRHIGTTVKRKLLSVSEKRKIDGERQRAIDIYRQMKAQKQS